MWNNIFMIILAIAFSAVSVIGVFGFSYIVYLIFTWIAEKLRR